MVDTEIIDTFRKGTVYEINDFLYDIYEKRSNIITRDEIKELFTYFDYNKIKQEEYQNIEDLLIISRALDFHNTEIYKLIVQKALENIEQIQYIIQYLIEDGTLSIITKEQLGSLNIKKICLEEKGLGDIPKEIGYISSLEEIYLISCKFKTLPNTLNKLKNLRKLLIMFSSDDYEYLELPAIIENLTSLEDLSINFFNTNKQSLFHIHFPILLDKLISLKSLSLSSNYLWSIPKEVLNLTKLERLDLAGNKLDSLPKTLKNLKNLKSLKLESNQFKKFPEIITEINSLKELYIGGNNFHDLPYSIGNLKSLEILKFSTDYVAYGNLETLPDSIGDLTSLKELDVSFNNLKELPESIGKLKNLERLILENNSLTQIPNSIGKLLNLRIINLRHNRLEFLPKSIKDLKNLESIELDSHL